MCFSAGQRPPAPPHSSDIAEHRALELTAGDGNRLAAFEAVPTNPRGAGLVLLPDIRGLHPYYTDLALQCATAGLHTVAIDPYGRTAGPGPRDDDFDYQPHAASLSHGNVLTDTRAALTQLRERTQAPVFTLGFCKFGGESWRLSATNLALAGCIGFYGRPSSALDVVPLMTIPLLVLAAGADQATSPAENEHFDDVLSDAGVEHLMVTYDGAPHSFFDRSFEQWQHACTDAWRQVLDFIDAHR